MTNKMFALTFSFFSIQGLRFNLKGFYSLLIFFPFFFKPAPNHSMEEHRPFGEDFLARQHQNKINL